MSVNFLVPQGKRVCLPFKLRLECYFSQTLSEESVITPIIILVP